MIQFKVSAPGSLKLFGDHTKNIMSASINLRTMLIFKEISLENVIEINFPQIYLYFQASVQGFLAFYNICFANMKLLHENVMQYTSNLYFPANQRVIIQRFYYLLAYVTYKEQIKIKSFNITLSTEFFLDEEYVCPTSFTVCLAACLLNWSHVQKGIYNYFGDFDLQKIFQYAGFCEKIFPESRTIDVSVCTYGEILTSRLEVEEKPYACPLKLNLPITILLVKSKQIENLEFQEQRELTNVLPENMSIALKKIDIIMNIAFCMLQELSIIDRNEIDIERNIKYLSPRYKTLEDLICKNQKLLQSLDASYCRLDKICTIAQTYGWSGKYTNIGNGRLYAYIWCPLYTYEPTNIELLSNELKQHGFDVIKTNLTFNGVRIEPLTQSVTQV